MASSVMIRVFLLAVALLSSVPSVWKVMWLTPATSAGFPGWMGSAARSHVLSSLAARVL